MPQITASDQPRGPRRPDRVPPRRTPDTTPGSRWVPLGGSGGSWRRRSRRRPAACPGGTRGSARPASSTASRTRCAVRRLTWTSWPWIPRQSRTSPCSPTGTRTGCGTSHRGTTLRRRVERTPTGRRRRPPRPAAASAAARRSASRRRRRDRPAGQQQLPNRSRSRAVAASPPSWTAVPSRSQMISASCSAPIGAHRRSPSRSAMPRPAPRSHTQPEDVGLGGAVAEAARRGALPRRSVSGTVEPYEPPRRRRPSSSSTAISALGSL